MIKQSVIEQIRKKFCCRLSPLLKPHGYLEIKNEKFVRMTPEARLSAQLQIAFWQVSKTYSVTVWMHIYHVELEKYREQYQNQNKLYLQTTYRAHWAEVCRPNSLGSDSFAGLENGDEVIEITAQKIINLVLPFLDCHATLDSLKELFETQWKTFPRLPEVAEALLLIYALRRDIQSLERVIGKLSSIRMVSEPCSKRQASLNYGMLLLKTFKGNG